MYYLSNTRPKKSLDLSFSATNLPSQPQRLTVLNTSIPVASIEGRAWVGCWQGRLVSQDSHSRQGPEPSPKALTKPRLRKALSNSVARYRINQLLSARKSNASL